MKCLALAALLHAVNRHVHGFVPTLFGGADFRSAQVD